ncbi:hypothetical protein OAI00_03190 [Euryarchaeota archaeon]|nr:hypothetical protein [Euryarchaeota archaeon]
MKNYIFALMLILSVSLAGCLDSLLDDDGDGIMNNDDNCVDITNVDQIDTDDDGTGDACDIDDDNDGFLDDNDVFSLNFNESIDTDSDGIGNNADTDDDDDGYSDIDEMECLPESEPLNSDSIPHDYDGDFLCDSKDNDDDNDNCLDENDAFPFNAGECIDSDGDGLGDNEDTDDDGDGTADVNDEFPLDPNEWEDSDGDGYGDNGDVFPLDYTEWEDSDGDDIGNNADWDDNGNGYLQIYFSYFEIWQYGDYDQDNGLPDVYAYVGFGNWDGNECNDISYNTNYAEDVKSDADILSDWWILDYDVGDSWSSACVDVSIYDNDPWDYDDELDYVTGEPTSYLFVNIDLSVETLDIYSYDNRGENSLSIKLEFEILTWTALLQ